MIAAAEFVRPEGARLLDLLGQPGVPLADLTADSRTVKMGSIFVAYPGTAQDGRAFIGEAITRGAAAMMRATVRASHTTRLPPLGASKMPKCVTVPQAAVGAGNVITTALLIWPPVPLELPLVEPCVPVQFVSDGGRLTRP